MNFKLCIIFFTFATLSQDFFTIEHVIPNETLSKMTVPSL